MTLSSTLFVTTRQSSHLRRIQREKNTQREINDAPAIASKLMAED